MRRPRDAAAAALALALLPMVVACGPDDQPKAHRSTGRALPQIPAKPALEPLLLDAEFQMPVRPTEQISDGAVVVANPMPVPVTLTSIEPVYLAGQPAGVSTVLNTYVVALDRDDQSDQGLGLQRVYPPVVTRGETLSPVKGFVIPAWQGPQLRYALGVGLQVHTGMAVLVAMKVTYRVGDRTVVQLVEHQVRLCTGRPPGEPTCPPPPHV